MTGVQTCALPISGVPALHGDGRQGWGGGPSQPVAGRGEKGQGASPLPHSSMQQILPDIIRQVTAGLSADLATVAEGTAGPPAAAPDEPPDAERQTAQHE